MNNIYIRLAIVGGISYYIYNMAKEKDTSSPLSKYSKISVTDPNFKPILNPESGEIEDALNEKIENGENFITDPVKFNDNNPFDPSGSDPLAYAGGYADSYAAYY